MHSRIAHLPAAAIASLTLIALSVVGGSAAVLGGINTLADAWGNKAELAAPWPMLILQLLGALAVIRWRGWRGVVGTLLIAVPAVLALMSTSDDETFKPGLPGWVYAGQVVIIVASALALVPCAVHLRRLLLTGQSSKAATPRGRAIATETRIG